MFLIVVAAVAAAVPQVFLSSKSASPQNSQPVAQPVSVQAPLLYDGGGGTGISTPPPITPKYYLYKSNVGEWPPDDGQESLKCPNSDVPYFCHYSREDIVKKDCDADTYCTGYAYRNSDSAWFPDYKGAPIYRTFNDTNKKYWTGLTRMATIYKKS